MGKIVFCPTFRVQVNGSMMEWSETAGFWIFSQVSNFAYTKYDYIHPEIEATKLCADWKVFYQYLFMKYMDGNVKTARAIPEGYKYYAPKVEQPKYSEEFYKAIIDQTGDKLKVY